MKSLFSIMMGILISLLMSVQLNALDKIHCCCGDSSIVITPIIGGGSEGSGPRTPVVVPISASYNSFFGSVSLSFSSNLGEIEVEILNTISGYYDFGYIQTWPLSAIIPISGGPGHYIITFTLPSGQQYQGEFDVIL